MDAIASKLVTTTPHRCRIGLRYDYGTIGNEMCIEKAPILVNSVVSDFYGRPFYPKKFFHKGAG